MLVTLFRAIFSRNVVCDYIDKGSCAFGSGDIALLLIYQHLFMEVLKVSAGRTTKEPRSRTYIRGTNFGSLSCLVSSSTEKTVSGST